MPADRWRELVSGRVGVIKSVSPQGRGADEPQPPYLFTALLSNFDFRAASRTERIAAGKGRTEAEAQSAAVGEALERYCAYHWDQQRTFVAPVAEVGMRTMAPTDCVLYADEQYGRPGWPYHRWSPEEPVTWIEGVSLTDGEPVALPAGLVYLTYPTPRVEDFFAPANSNGLAAGATIASAAFSGLCELMERDALMIAWLNRIPAVELELDASAGIAASIARHYSLLGVELRAFALPTDFPVTVVLALATEESPGVPASVIGMGCHPSPLAALTKAVFELCQARPAEASRYRENSPEGRLTSYENVKTLDDHSAFAALPERRGEFAFLSAHGTTATLRDLPTTSDGDDQADLALCAAALREAGHQVAFTDLTLPDVEPFGYRVVRVLAAGLQPIHFGFGNERLGGTRLYELPRRLGLKPDPVTAADLNPCPHPMA